MDEIINKVEEVLEINQDMSVKPETAPEQTETSAVEETVNYVPSVVEGTVVQIDGFGTYHN